MSVCGTFVVFDSHCWNFADNSAGSFLSRSFPYLQSCWKITFNGNMPGDNMPKGSNTDAENCKNCLFVMCSGQISCSRCWIVKLKVSLLVCNGIFSTFVSSARLGFSDEYVYDGSSTTSNLFPCSCFLMNIINSFEWLFHYWRFIFAFSKINRDWM